MLNRLTMGGLLFRLGPVTLAQALLRYPWLRVLLKANDLHGKTCLNREGVYLEASAKTISFVVRCVVELVTNTFTRKNNVIIPLAELEKTHITKTLQYTKYSMKDTAKLLGIGRTTLYRKIKKYNILNIFK